MLTNLPCTYQTHLHHVQHVIEDVFQDVGEVIFAETDTTYHSTPTYVFGIALHEPTPHHEVLYLDASTCLQMSATSLYDEAESLCAWFKLTYTE